MPNILLAPQGAQRAPFSEDNVGDSNTGIFKKESASFLWHLSSLSSCAQVKVWHRLSSPAQWLQKKREKKEDVVGLGFHCSEPVSGCSFFLMVCWYCSHLFCHSIRWVCMKVTMGGWNCRRGWRTHTLTLFGGQRVFLFCLRLLQLCLVKTSDLGHVWFVRHFGCGGWHVKLSAPFHHFDCASWHNCLNILEKFKNHKEGYRLFWSVDAHKGSGYNMCCSDKWLPPTHAQSTYISAFLNVFVANMCLFYPAVSSILCLRLLCFFLPPWGLSLCSHCILPRFINLFFPSLSTIDAVPRLPCSKPYSLGSN